MYIEMAWNEVLDQNILDSITLFHTHYTLDT